MKHIVSTFLFAASFFIALNHSPLEGSMMVDDGYPRQPQYDALHYDLALTLSDTSNVIWGEAKLTIRLRSSTLPETLRLDLKEMLVAQVRVEQRDAAFDQQRGALNIALPDRMKSGDTLDVTVAYHGEPQDGLIIANNKFGQRCIFADNWPDRARYWFPSLDHPSDKSTVSFSVTLPAHYTVVANGRLRNVRESMPGNKTWEWSEQVAIPTYCMVFGAADFTVIPIDTSAALPISYYVYPEEASHARENFGRVQDMVQFFTARFGAYPFEKLALVQSSTRYGGMENASAIFFAENSIGNGRNIEGTTAHEIAHQWFGNSATAADWHHLWLSEGFATYGEALFVEHADGIEKFRENMKAKRENYFNFASQARGPILDSTITNYMALLSPNNYAKAAWVLHMLRNVVGDEAFWRGVRGYYARYERNNALTQDFRIVMEEASGMPLQWFFQQWLAQSDYPRVRAQWRWLAETQRIELVLRQIQKPSFYRVPIAITAQFGAHAESHQIWMEKREQSFFLHAIREPEHIVLDPEAQLLMAAEVTKVGKSD